MRVWIENPFDNLPLEGFRAQRYWLMAEAFRKAGHEVTLWTSDFNHTTKRKRLVEDTRKDEGDGFSVRFIPTIPYYKNISIRRIISHLVYAISWLIEGTEASKTGNPDIIILSTPPICTGLVALYFKKRYGTKVVLDIMDLWPETFERVAPKWLLKPIKYLADHIRAKADVVTSVAKAYPGKTFYHGIQLGEGVGVGVGLRLVYIGNLGVTYDLEAVIEAVGKIEGATLKIAGEGVQSKTVADSAAKSGGKIEYLGYLDKEAMEELLKESDIGVIPMAPECCVGIPYKLADYAASGLAIVSSLGGESAALLKKYGAGEEYKPYDVSSLVKAIEDIRPRLAEAKKSAKLLAEEELDAEKIYRRYVEYVTENMV